MAAGRGTDPHDAFVEDFLSNEEQINKIIKISDDVLSEVGKSKADAMGEVLKNLKSSYSHISSEEGWATLQSDDRARKLKSTLAVRLDGAREYAQDAYHQAWMATNLPEWVAKDYLASIEATKDTPLLGTGEAKEVVMRPPSKQDILKEQFTKSRFSSTVPVVDEFLRFLHRQHQETVESCVGPDSDSKPRFHHYTTVLQSSGHGKSKLLRDLAELAKKFDLNQETHLRLAYVSIGKGRQKHFPIDNQSVRQILKGSSHILPLEDRHVAFLGITLFVFIGSMIAEINDKPLTEVQQFNKYDFFNGDGFWDVVCGHFESFVRKIDSETRKNEHLASCLQYIRKGVLPTGRSSLEEPQQAGSFSEIISKELLLYVRIFEEVSEGFSPPCLVLAIDEAKSLTSESSIQGQEYLTSFRILRRALFALLQGNNSKYLFLVFTDTNSRGLDFVPPPKKDPSLRIDDDMPGNVDGPKFCVHHPFFQVFNFKVAAEAPNEKGNKEDKKHIAEFKTRCEQEFDGTLMPTGIDSESSTMANDKHEWCLDYGRPLWRSVNQIYTAQRRMVEFALRKLQNGTTSTTDASLLACLAVRVPVHFSERFELSSELVASNMATCIGMSDDREYLTISYPYEPVLSMGGSMKWKKGSLLSALSKLNEIGLHNIADTGTSGELTSCILLQIVMDMTKGQKNEPYFDLEGEADLLEFLHILLSVDSPSLHETADDNDDDDDDGNEDGHTDVMNEPISNSQAPKDASKNIGLPSFTFPTGLQGAKVCFLRIVAYDRPVWVEELPRLFSLRVAVMLRKNAWGSDILIPVKVPGDGKTPDRYTVILIQVKNYKLISGKEVREANDNKNFFPAYCTKCRSCKKRNECANCKWMRQNHVAVVLSLGRASGKRKYRLVLGKGFPEIEGIFHICSNKSPSTRTTRSKQNQVDETYIHVAVDNAVDRILSSIDSVIKPKEVAEQLQILCNACRRVDKWIDKSIEAANNRLYIAHRTVIAGANGGMDMVIVEDSQEDN